MPERKKRYLSRKESETESVKMARAQLARLHRQFKIMEGSRLSYQTETNVYLAKQRMLIKVLTGEKGNLGSENLVSCLGPFKHNLSQFISEKEGLEAEVNKSQFDLQEISEELRKTDLEIRMFLRKCLGTEPKLDLLSTDNESYVGILETKLSIVTVDLNKVIARNKMLRMEIENLLAHRGRFKEILDASMEKLKEGKALILEIIQQATSAYENREEAQTKLQMLQDKNTSVEENHAHQVRELDRQLYKDIERIKFLTIKGQHRIMDELEMKKEQKELERRRVVEETLVQHKTLFQQLREFYNEDVDNMCAMYLKAEEENYALFNYVNEVNCETENLHEAAKILKEKVLDERAMKSERALQQNEDLKMLEAKLEAIHNSVKILAQQKADLTHYLSNIIDKCCRLFTQAKCHSSPFFTILGSSVSLTQQNLDVLLKIFQHYIINILWASWNEVTD